MTTLVIVVVIAIVLVSWLMSPLSPFGKPGAPQLIPISVGQVQKLYRMETAEVTSFTNIEGETKSLLPFSSEKYIYQLVVTMSAGIDMEMLRDGDITVSGDTVTIKVPTPKVLRTERSGRVVWHSREVFSGFSEDPGLLDKIQNEGQARITKTVLEQGELMRKARINAEDNLRNLILQLGYKNVVFTYDEKTTPTAPITARPG
jgi:Protein of unknown function (DUF4230)